MEGCDVQQVSLDVMPMSPGFLPLPTVYLSKYIPADQKGNLCSHFSVKKILSLMQCNGVNIHM